MERSNLEGIWRERERESKVRKEGKRGEHEEEGAGTNGSNLKGEGQKGRKRLTEGKKTGKQK